MSAEKNRSEEIIQAWLNQIETALKQTESLAGFHRLDTEGRRPGNEIDSFFYGKTSLEFIDSQVYLQLLQLEWQEVKGTLDLVRVGDRQLSRMRRLEARLKSTLNAFCSPLPAGNMEF